MNAHGAYNTSSAHKPEASVARKQAPQQRLRVVKGRKSKRKAISPSRVALLFLGFMIAICFVVYNQVCLSEVTGEINKLNETIKVLESENSRLQSQLEPNESQRIIAQRATKELGMRRLELHQASRVYIYQVDKIELTQLQEPEGFKENVEGFLTSVFQKIASIFSGSSREAPTP